MRTAGKAIVSANRGEKPRKDIVACSGGKDSTALALILHERKVPFDILYTSTGNEPPGVDEYVKELAKHTGARILDLEAPTLFECIEQFSYFPKHSVRYCTRMIKIEPCVELFRSLPPHAHMLHVGLRADEMDRKGIYDELVDRRFILRELDMDVEDVIGFVESRGFVVPRRTDCMLCPFQRLGDWKWLLDTYPEQYREGCLLEARLGATLRSPSRDTWPASLTELAYEFTRGVPLPTPRITRGACRVCTM